MTRSSTVLDSIRTHLGDAALVAWDRDVPPDLHIPDDTEFSSWANLYDDTSVGRFFSRAWVMWNGEDMRHDGLGAVHSSGKLRIIAYDPGDEVGIRWFVDPYYRPFNR